MSLPSFTLPEEEDPEEEDPDGEPPPVARVRVLRRTDYDVTDVDAVIAAGRAAYRQVWPDDQEEDAVADVTGLSRALYQIEHAGGPAALDHAPGLVETSSSVVWELDPEDDPSDDF